MQITYEDVEFYIKNGYIKFADEVIDISRYSRDRIRFLLSIADTKDIKVVFDLEENLFVKMSKLALQRIIDNNITNAIKYSPKGTKVIINLYLEGDKIILSVQDFGCGIKDVKKVFERYEREDLVQGGFGLGLSIVKEICQKYDIQYDVKTTLNEGSVFLYKFSRISV